MMGQRITMTIEQVNIFQTVTFGAALKIMLDAKGSAHQGDGLADDMQLNVHNENVGGQNKFVMSKV
jgi:hypothetical protein